MTLDEALRAPITIVVEATEEEGTWVRRATVEELPEVVAVGQDMEVLVQTVERQRVRATVRAVLRREWRTPESILRDRQPREALEAAGLAEFVSYLTEDVETIPQGLEALLD